MTGSTTTHPVTAALGLPRAADARLARSREKHPGRWVATAAALVSATALLPLGFVVWVTINTPWPTIVAMVWRPKVGELLVNTTGLIAFTLPLCIALGVGLAFLTERTDMPFRRLMSALSVAPLAVPAFVHSYAWVSLVPSLNGLFAGVMVSVLAYFPFLYLPVAATLRRLDPALEDVGASLGLTPFRIFFRIVLPQLKLAILGGVLLIALHLLSEYGLYAMVRFDTFTTAIFDQFQSTFSGPAANMLSGILAVLCLVVLMGEIRVRGATRYARLGGGTARAQRPLELGWAGGGLASLIPLAVAVFSLGVPLVTLARWLWLGGTAAWKPEEVIPALGQTLGLGILGAVVTTLAAIPVAWLVVRRPSRLVRVLEGVNYIASALPGIVMALALVTVAVRIAHPLYQTMATLLLAYLMMFLAPALVSLRASIAQAPAELEEVARSLGRSPARALWAVTMRLAAPGAAAGAALVFLGVVNELTATLLLAPNGVETLSTQFWNYSNEIDYTSAAPYALLMVALSLPLTWLLYRQSLKLAGR